MAKVRTDPSGRRHVDIDEVVETRLAEIKAAMPTDVPERVFVQPQTEPAVYSCEGHPMYAACSHSIVAADVEFIRSDVAMQRAIEIVREQEVATGKNYSHVIAALGEETKSRCK